MTDPRKPVFRPGNEAQEASRRIAHAYLLAATEEGAKAIGTTGASFVIIGMGIWACELAELDGDATARMLRALADLYDPASSGVKKVHAEKKRRAAVNRLFAAVDIDMSATGRAN